MLLGFFKVVFESCWWIQCRSDRLSFWCFPSLLLFLRPQLLESWCKSWIMYPNKSRNIYKVHACQQVRVIATVFSKTCLISDSLHTAVSRSPLQPQLLNFCVFQTPPMLFLPTRSPVAVTSTTSSKHSSYTLWVLVEKQQDRGPSAW